MRFPLSLSGLLAASVIVHAQTPTPSPALDYAFFRDQVQPIFLAKRAGHARCITCHRTGTPRLVDLPAGQATWTEEQSRQNFEVWSKLVTPGRPDASRLLLHPLAKAAGGDVFHAGGRHWDSKADPEWQTLAAWVRGAALPPGVRIIQTNAAGDNSHVIDPVTNTVVAVIQGIEVPHGISAAPDGARVYLTNEAQHTLDIVETKSWKVVAQVPLSGRPNNLMVSKDGLKVYVGIAQAPGAVDVIDTDRQARLTSVTVDGPVHNVYVTPDGKHAVSGSVQTGVISVIDTVTDTLAWSVKLDRGIRPMTFDTKPDGSTGNIYAQLTNYHGAAVIDFASRREVARFELPAIPGQHRELEGLQGAPAHGLAVTPDQKLLLSTSKWYGALYMHSLPDRQLVGTVVLGSHPEWIALTPDGTKAYISVAGEDQTVAVDLKTKAVVARVGVGAVPKRVGTLLMSAAR